MKVNFHTVFSIFVLAALGLGACHPGTSQPAEGETPALKVLAVETFLAEIAQNVAGDRVKVASLIPLGLDPHTFEPTPQDVRKIAESNVLILNGAGFEEWAKKTLENAGGERQIIEASAGLNSRTAREGEAVMSPHEGTGETHHEGDPHFWLDPTLVVKYVENIRDGLIAVDPAGKDVYNQNAAAYIVKLNDLDGWIKAQVALIPAERRLIVTNHESFGYFADRYGFQIIGTITPSVSSGSAPSAQQLAQLVDHIRASGVSVIFIETGSSTQLAEQVAAETGVKVVTDLYSHSITDLKGAAPTYIDMMKHNVNKIVEALK